METHTLVIYGPVVILGVFALMACLWKLFWP